jgi:DNA replication licensing factor MCM4
MKQNQVYSLNLDCQKLSSYPQSKKLFLQLVHYPQEIIPLMDHVLTDIFLERFDDGTIPQDIILKIRPFNLPSSLNLRELNPESIPSFLFLSYF